jgi:hypothetical protein
VWYEEKGGRKWERGEGDRAAIEKRGREKKGRGKRKEGVGCAGEGEKKEKRKRKREKRKEKGKKENEWDTCPIVSSWEKIRLSSPIQSCDDTWRIDSLFYLKPQL